MRQSVSVLTILTNAGHWRRGSVMCRTYDSADCVVELTSKEQVRSAVQGGWQCVASSCLPSLAPQKMRPFSQQSLILPTLSTPPVVQPSTPPREEQPIYVIHEV